MVRSDATSSSGFNGEHFHFPGEIGLRSDVNAHARADRLDVTQGDYQSELIVV